MAWCRSRVRSAGTPVALTDLAWAQCVLSGEGPELLELFGVGGGQDPAVQGFVAAAELQRGAFGHRSGELDEGAKSGGPRRQDPDVAGLSDGVGLRGQDLDQLVDMPELLAGALEVVVNLDE